MPGALQAGSDLSNDLGNQLNNAPTFTPLEISDATTDATNAINAEENSTSFQSSNPNGTDYVSLAGAGVTPPPGDSVGNGVTMNVVTITISNVSVSLIPVVKNISLSVHATARYS